jgi:hypothetical protein
MTIYIGTLTEQSRKSLYTFLGRTDLKGSEVGAFNILINELRGFKKQTSEEPKAQETPTPSKE